MNYLWEVALCADNCGVAREKLNYQPAKKCSPYIEASFTDLNETKISEKVIEANPLYRFTHIFAAVFDINLTVSEKTRNILFDICMQYIIQIDLRQGLSKSEYYLRFILRDLLQKVYQDKFQEAVQYFTHIELRKILVCMSILFRCSSSIILFRRAIRAVYPDALVYESNDDFHTILIYIGKAETIEERSKVNFIIDVFLSKDYESHLFWEHHFGIIDIEVTMEIDNMVLF